MGIATKMARMVSCRLFRVSLVLVDFIGPSCSECFMIVRFITLTHSLLFMSPHSNACNSLFDHFGWKRLKYWKTWLGIASKDGGSVMIEVIEATAELRTRRDKMIHLRIISRTRWNHFLANYVGSIPGTAKTRYVFRSSGQVLHF